MGVLWDNGDGTWDVLTASGSLLILRDHCKAEFLERNNDDDK
jgi:hypothetical protein